MAPLVKAMRAHWTTTSTLPCLLGLALAYQRTGRLDIIFASTMLLSSFIAHVMMEIWDDLSDFRLFRADQYRGGAHVPRTRFAGGSGTLTSGTVKPAQLATLLAI